MIVKDILVKVHLRLNKAASQDYDNIWKYHIEEAFYKAELDVIRRLVRGKNQTQEGDEETLSRIDDLQSLLKPLNLNVRDKGVYAESDRLPNDYLYDKRISPIVSKNECLDVSMFSALREEANVDVLLKTLPSFEFEETFHTLVNNRVRVYHNKEFKVERIDGVYYRKPVKVDFGILDTLIEFKDDLCELMVDETVKIIASDLESLNQKQLAQERAETNN